MIQSQFHLLSRIRQKKKTTYIEEKIQIVSGSLPNVPLRSEIELAFMSPSNVSTILDSWGGSAFLAVMIESVRKFRCWRLEKLLQPVPWTFNMVVSVKFLGLPEQSSCTSFLPSSFCPMLLNWFNDLFSPVFS